MIDKGSSFSTGHIVDALIRILEKPRFCIGNTSISVMGESEIMISAREPGRIIMFTLVRTFVLLVALIFNIDVVGSQAVRPVVGFSESTLVRTVGIECSDPLGVIDEFSGVVIIVRTRV